MTRLKQSRAFYIPKEYTEKRLGANKGTEVYLFKDKNGRPSAKGFKGRAQKPTFHYYYPNEEQRELSLKRWMDAEAELAIKKENDRKKRRAPHSLNIGDILSSSWGWEQTNVDFYQVISLPSPFFVEIRKIASELENENRLQGKASPIKDKFTSEAFRKRPDADNVIRMSSYSYARPWSGKPMHVSWYA